ncbi:glutamine amidotransferase [bacterium]|nr:glutamine amidotransferase [bacterium]
MRIEISYLSPDLMSLYGDVGNVITIIRRCQWRNIKCEIYEVKAGERADFRRADLLFMGGGQDKGQRIVGKDLQNYKEEIKGLVENGLPALLICGGYQLFGKYSKTKDGVYIPGIDVLDIWAVGGERRMIGNVVIESLLFDQLVGFENHSGRTFLGEKVKPLGKIVKGYGNNGRDKLEEAIYKNVLGTYLHGPFLPQVADWLIAKALSYRYKDYKEEISLEPMDETLEHLAHNSQERRAYTAKTLHI